MHSETLRSEDPKRILKCLQVCESNDQTDVYTHALTQARTLSFGGRVSRSLGWPGAYCTAEDEDGLELLILLPFPIEK